MTTPSTEGLKPCEHCGASVGWIPGDRYESAQETIRDLRRQIKAAQASEAAIRNAALEEVADICDSYYDTQVPMMKAGNHSDAYMTGYADACCDLGNAIRALSTAPAEPVTDHIVDANDQQDNGTKSK